MLLLHAGKDFVSYTPREKRNFHENLQGLGPESPAEWLELVIWKDIHNFTQLSENSYHMYHSTEELQGEPQAITVWGEDDAHVTRRVQAAHLPAAHLQVPGPAPA